MDSEGRSNFEYRGWQVHIEPPDAGVALHADLSYQGKYTCRLVLSSEMDASCAWWALDSKARNFIDEWSMRPRRSGTQSQEL
jgi:hypothetical protein